MFLAWTAFRLYSHYKALKGAQHLQLCAQQRRVDWCASPALTRLLHDDLQQQQQQPSPAPSPPPASQDAASSVSLPAAATSAATDSASTSTNANDSASEAGEGLGGVEYGVSDGALHELERVARAPHLAAICLRFKHRRQHSAAT